MVRVPFFSGISFIVGMIFCLLLYFFSMKVVISIFLKKTFEAIGKYIGGLVSISSQTLNLVDCVVAYIEVKNNLCFLPATILIKD